MIDKSAMFCVISPLMKRPLSSALLILLAGARPPWRKHHSSKAWPFCETAFRRKV